MNLVVRRPVCRASDGLAIQAETKPTTKTRALTDAEALDLVLLLGTRNGGTLDQGVNELAGVIGWSTGKTSTMTTRWARDGLIRKEQHGKRSVISVH